MLADITEIFKFRDSIRPSLTVNNYYLVVIKVVVK